ncbi:MAG: TatD family hydrolase [Pseudomonadota bacterium]
MWIDSHCHLTHERMIETYTPEELVQNAREAGVEGMLNISCGIKGDFVDVLSTAKQFDNVWCAVGTHPHNAGDQAEQGVSQEELVKLAHSDDKIIGIGETGLDYYYDYAPRDLQEQSFRKHIRACIEADMPIVIHARDADEDIARIMFEEEGARTNLRGVMHCFSSGAELAQKALDFGFYISFSGIITFKQAEKLREIAKNVPLERILVETDAPFLAPVPYRGQTNQPAYVSHTGQVIADIHNINKESLASHSKNNFFTLFNKAKML